MEFYDKHENEKKFSPDPGLEVDSYVDEEATYLEELKHKQDDFLDTYSLYMHYQSEFAKNLVKRKAIELEVLDPTFDFDID